MPVLSSLGSDQMCFTIYPNIYLTDDLFAELIMDHPPEWANALLKHEQTHLARQKEMGKILWLFKYLTSGKFRFHEELEAVRVEFNFMKEKGWLYNLDGLAKTYSGKTYFHPVSYGYAEKALAKAWEEA